MSLIHDALKSMEAPHAPKPAAMRAPAAVARPRPAWLDAALAFAVVLGAGVLGWFIWQNHRLPKAHVTPVVVAPAVVGEVAPQTVVVAPVPAAPAPAGVVAAAHLEQVARVEAATVAPAAVAQGQTPSPQVLPSQVPSATASVNEVASPPKSAATSRPVRTAPRAAPVRQQARADKPVVAPTAPAPVVDDAPVELRFARFVAAMKETRTADAERELAGLRERLPAGSLGLLRAQAWFDLRAGRDAAAAEGYSAILDRMPGDEEAAINLASIQSRQKKTEEARATLDAATRLQPDSAALRAALAQFTPATR